MWFYGTVALLCPLCLCVFPTVQRPRGEVRQERLQASSPAAHLHPGSRVPGGGGQDQTADRLQLAERSAVTQ